MNADTAERIALDRAILTLIRTWARDVAPDNLDKSTVNRMAFYRWLARTGRLNEGN